MMNKNVLIQDDPQDTLLYAAAILACLQSVDVKTGLSDEAELGMNLILTMVQDALRYAALNQQ